MKIIDMHCDSVMTVKFERKPSLRSNHAEACFDNLKKGGYLAQFFAVFSSAKAVYSPSPDSSPLLLDRYKWIRNAFYNEMDANRDLIAQAKSVSDILENEKKGLLSAVLTIEDGAPIENDINNLDLFKRDGVRVFGLVWNYENQLAYPNSRDPEIMEKPLKPFGKEAVARLNELNIVIDVSHLNDGGFRDVCALSKKPFFATHSNARALTPHPRNLTDEQLRALGEKGCVAGLNFCPFFLHSRGDNTVFPEDIAAHAVYMANTAGIDSVGFGSDFDGTDGVFSFKNAAGIKEVINALSKRFTESELEKICFKNVLRVLKDNE